MRLVVTILAWLFFLSLSVSYSLANETVTLSAPLRVYNEPSASSSLFMALLAGQQVEVVSDEGNGFKKVFISAKVTGGQDKIGYVEAADLSSAREVAIKPSAPPQGTIKSQANDAGTTAPPTVPTAFALKDPVGIGKFCRVFATGVGSCDYDDLESCQTSLKANDEACLPNKIGATTATSQYAPFPRTRAALDESQDETRDLGYHVVPKEKVVQFIERKKACLFAATYVYPKDTRGIPPAIKIRYHKPQAGDIPEENIILCVFEGVLEPNSINERKSCMLGSLNLKTGRHEPYIITRFIPPNLPVKDYASSKEPFCSKRNAFALLNTPRGFHIVGVSADKQPPSSTLWLDEVKAAKDVFGPTSTIEILVDKLSIGGSLKQPPEHVGK